MNYFEIYMENLNNLLSSDKLTGECEKLKILNNTAYNAEPVTVFSPEDIFKNI